MSFLLKMDDLLINNYNTLLINIIDYCELLEIRNIINLSKKMRNNIFDPINILYNNKNEFYKSSEEVINKINLIRRDIDIDSDFIIYMYILYYMRNNNLKSLFQIKGLINLNINVKDMGINKIILDSYYIEKLIYRDHLFCSKTIIHEYGKIRDDILENMLEKSLDNMIKNNKKQLNTRNNVNITLCDLILRTKNKNLIKKHLEVIDYSNFMIYYFKRNDDILNDFSENYIESSYNYKNNIRKVISYYEGSPENKNLCTKMLLKNPKALGKFLKYYKSGHDIITSFDMIKNEDVYIGLLEHYKSKIFTHILKNPFIVNFIPNELININTFLRIIRLNIKSEIIIFKFFYKTKINVLFLWSIYIFNSLYQPADNMDLYINCIKNLIKWYFSEESKNTYEKKILDKSIEFQILIIKYNQLPNIRLKYITKDLLLEFLFANSSNTIRYINYELDNYNNEDLNLLIRITKIIRLIHSNNFDDILFNYVKLSEPGETIEQYKEIIINGLKNNYSELLIKLDNKIYPLMENERKYLKNNNIIFSNNFIENELENESKKKKIKINFN